jgi:4-azaleucine resistance transporter AzlC
VTRERSTHRRDSVVLAAAVGVFGITFGVLATTSGLTVAQASAMSLLVFTGASQFAAVGVIGAGGEPVSAVGSALLLAARNGAYALTLDRVLPSKTSARVVAAQLVIDESTGMALAQQSRSDQREAFWITGLGVFVFWNLGTILGAISGEAIGDPKTWGLDAAFPAGFMTFVIPHVRERPGLVAALVGGGIAVLAVPLVPAGAPVLLSVLGAMVSWVCCLRGRT